MSIQNNYKTNKVTDGCFHLHTACWMAVL